MKTYTVTIELDMYETRVSAKNKAEARKKALSKLNRKKPSSIIRRSWGAKRLEIDIDEV